MNIQSISSSVRTPSCQPIRSQSFAQAGELNFVIDTTEDGDVFTPSDAISQDPKLDLACRLAAYWQLQCENMQKKTGCLA